MKRATMGKEGLKDVILVDGVIIGQGCGCKKCLKSCKALMNELNESDEKCDIVKDLMQEIDVLDEKDELVKAIL